ncbi:hypothetical protein GDO81_001556 [Engystomops pustulosus]|uniref:Uncharacterized protein n=1 Tax=Engystomops pustulosus TaxID=76066 RepID=A0AAV7DG38_ENGPU|nr:hypothetical protein GDO81_001556 [Engystomops pustulosus]
MVWKLWGLLDQCTSLYITFSSMDSWLCLEAVFLCLAHSSLILYNHCRDSAYIMAQRRLGTIFIIAFYLSQSLNYFCWTYGKKEMDTNKL